MTQLTWRCIEGLARWLRPEEREAVLGDLAESGDSPARAAAQVLGLVVRRQAASGGELARTGSTGVIAVLIGLMVAGSRPTATVVLL